MFVLFATIRNFQKKILHKYFFDKNSFRRKNKISLLGNSLRVNLSEVVIFSITFWRIFLNEFILI